MTVVGITPGWIITEAVDRLRRGHPPDSVLAFIERFAHRLDEES